MRLTTTSRTLAILGAAAGVAVVALPGIATGNASTGFSQPYMGTPWYERFSASEATLPSQVHAPLGQAAADWIASQIGLDKDRVFTPRQRFLFMTGKGVGGQKEPAKLVDQSVRILTNTTGRPLYAKVDGRWTPTVLASYGLIVNREGLLESPAHSTSPSRQINVVLQPGGYMGTWARANGAGDSIDMLYESAYTGEAIFGAKAQDISGVAQLVPNQKGDISATVGMSVAPAIYIVNFALIYTLSPRLAAKMPARWVAIPPDVAAAIAASPTGQVPYSEYAAALTPESGSRGRDRVRAPGGLGLPPLQWTPSLGR